MRTLLLDGDILCYLNSFQHEVATEVEPGYWTWYCDFNKVQSSVEETLAYFMDALEADDYIVCLSDYDKSFRKELLPSYKEQRTRNKKPLTLKAIRQWLIDEKGAVIYPSLEGDDVMSLLALSGEVINPLIVSLDKDMKTIPCQLYRNITEGVLTISEKEADYWHLFQTLTGDIVDGYSGCPGIGAVTAKKILDKECSWRSVVNTYISKGLTEEDAILQARMARILRPSEWNFNKKEVVLWHPE